MGRKREPTEAQLAALARAREALARKRKRKTKKNKKKEFYRKNEQ